jgi:probable F420-dependent oxidoreductase
MREYLDAMDAAPYDAPAPEASMVRVLGALGPRMLSLAAERCDGAHPYLVPSEHTRRAREILGPSKLLCPEVAVILDDSPARARAVARRYLATYLSLTNYRTNLERFDYGEVDFAGGGSDRLVDALVGWGGTEQVAARVREHLDAGADHVAVQVLVEDPSRLPAREWEALAGVLLG